MSALIDLERRLAREQEIFSYPSKPWTPELDHEGSPVLDVLVIGAGQAGLTVSAKLLREGMRRLLVVDASPEGREGPWMTWARMHTLRTMKTLHGIDGGFEAASFRSWYEAQHGEEGYRKLNLIPKEDWQNYLSWFRKVMQIPVRNNTLVSAIERTGNYWRVQLMTGSGGEEIIVRKIVASTGINHSGGPRLPEGFAELPRALWAHSSDAVDFTALAGKRVAVIGSGASAFDNAATAAEAGATVVHHVRREALPEVNTLRFLETRGLFRNFGHLPDELRLRISRRTLGTAMPPPPHAVERCTSLDGYELRLGSPWSGVRGEGEGVVASTPRGEETYDFVILGTGFDVDLSKVEWLRHVAPHITLWGDRMEYVEGPVDERVARFPYLDGNLRAVAREEEWEHHIGGLYFFNQAGYASVGDTAIGNNAISWGSDLVVQGISRDLMLEDGEHFTEEYAKYEQPEFSLTKKL